MLVGSEVNCFNTRPDRSALDEVQLADCRGGHLGYEWNGSGQLDAYSVALRLHVDDRGRPDVAWTTFWLRPVQCDRLGPDRDRDVIRREWVGDGEQSS